MYMPVVMEVFHESELKGWSVEPSLMELAKPNAKLMLSASPIRAIPIAPEILASKASQLLYQAEFRLRVHKRLLHWVFETSKAHPLVTHFLQQDHTSQSFLNSPPTKNPIFDHMSL